MDLKLIQYLLAKVDWRINTMSKFLIMVIFTFLIISCGPDERSLEYKYMKISGIVDSVIILKPLDTKRFFFLISEKWSVVPSKYYVEFIHYISKGDSLYKEPSRWDIFAYKKKNGKYIEKYFIGAQDNWD